MNEVIAWAGFAGAWLLPPAMYVLRRRSNRAFRQATFAQLTPQSARGPAPYLVTPGDRACGAGSGPPPPVISMLVFPSEAD